MQYIRSWCVVKSLETECLKALCKHLHLAIKNLTLYTVGEFFNQPESGTNCGRLATSATPEKHASLNNDSSEFQDLTGLLRALQVRKDGRTRTRSPDRSKSRSCTQIGVLVTLLYLRQSQAAI
jgi:hypothetical protein